MAVVLPTDARPEVAAHIAFARGSLTRLGGSVDGLNLAVNAVPPVFLQKIGFGFATQPFRLHGDIGLTGGPRIAGFQAIRADGGFVLAFTNPAVFEVTGQAKLVNLIPIGNAKIRYVTPFDLSVNGEFGIRFSFEGVTLIDSTQSMGGRIFPGGFHYEQGFTTGFLGVNADVSFIISSIGAAGCAGGETKVFDAVVASWHFGFGYRWGGALQVMERQCDVGPYRPTSSSVRASAAAQTVTLKKGLRGAVIGVVGRDASPQIKITGPKGERAETPENSEAPWADRILTYAYPPEKTTFVVIPAPSPGAWKVETKDGSSSIAAVRQADGLPPARVRGRVSGKGRNRVLTWKARAIQGQRIRFMERGGRVMRELGVSRKAEGKLRFRPVDGPGGRRQILALVESYGSPRKTVTAGSYKAPPAIRPAKVRKVRLTRQGSRLVIRWKRASGAQRYEVRTTVKDGRRLYKLTTKPRITIPTVSRTETATVRIAGVSRIGTRGKTAKTNLKKAATKRKKGTQKKRKGGKKKKR